MEDTILQLGMGGALAWLLVKEIKEIVIAFTKKKTGDIGNPTSGAVTGADVKALTTAISDLFKIIKDVRVMTKDLHDWHDHDDPNNPGSKVWYGKRAADLMEKVDLKMSQIARSCGINGKDT